MDRVIVYADQQAQDSDILSAQKNTLIALGWAIQAFLQSGTWVDGLACAPGTGLNVSVAPGAIYTAEAIDATGYGSLGADTRTVTKQGLSLNTITLACPAPATSGQSINYLIEAQYQDVDGGSTLLPYYNSANPSIPYSGPANNGINQSTVRQGVLALQIKAGTPATTGSQTTPAADSGWTPLWVVTVANGASSISSGNIVKATGAPFITGKLPIANFGGDSGSGGSAGLVPAPPAGSTASGYVLRPDGTWGLPVGKAELTVPYTGSGAGTIAHGLGAMPKRVDGLFRCTIADQGFSVGAEVPVRVDSTYQGGSNKNEGACAWAKDATYCGYWFGADGVTLPSPSSGGIITATSGSWTLVIRASLNF